MILYFDGLYVFNIINMISTCKFLSGGLLRAVPRFRMNHIKDMREENARVKMAELQNQPLIEDNSRVYKPLDTIEFNREGEVLLYSADPLDKEDLYFKYPYILYESVIPMSIINYVLNPLDMVWYWASFGLYGCLATTIPRIWYFSRFKWFPMKLYLLRGGRNIKVESHSVGGIKYTYWIENYTLKPLTQCKLRFDDRDEADFLTEEGQLKYDLDVESSEFKFFGVNTNNQQLYFRTYGTVHHPQLFEACLKGYNIDTTDFVINTADNIRYREGSHNV